MAIHYNIYTNDGAGGPVDYGTVLATATTPSYTPAAIPPGSDVTFAIRAFDDVTGLEERNVTARYRLRTGPGGNDLSQLPRAPVALQVQGGPGGSVVLEWAALPRSNLYADPLGFYVFLGSPTVDLTTGHQVASVAWLPLQATFQYTATGLTTGISYQFVVRAYSAAGTEQNTRAVTFIPVASGPAAVDSGGVEVVASDMDPSGFPPLPPS